MEPVATILNVMKLANHFVVGANVVNVIRTPTRAARMSMGIASQRQRAISAVCVRWMLIVRMMAPANVWVVPV